MWATWQPQSSERDPPLQNRRRHDSEPAIAMRTITSSFALFLVGLVLVFALENRLAPWPWHKLPDDPRAAARKILESAPVIVSYHCT
jgi:hypothetical protein